MCLAHCCFVHHQVFTTALLDIVYHLHFPDVEMRFRKVKRLPKITKLTSGRARTRASDPKQRLLPHHHAVSESQWEERALSCLVSQVASERLSFCPIVFIKNVV